MTWFLAKFMDCHYITARTEQIGWKSVNYDGELPQAGQITATWHINSNYISGLVNHCFGVISVMTSPEKTERYKRYQIGLLVLLGLVIFFESLILGLASLRQIERSPFLSLLFFLTI